MKFKVKAKVNGETIYSNGFMEFKSGVISIITKQNQNETITSPIDEGSLQMFTGITDKNKEDIYQNDILTNGKTTFKVEYNTQNTGFFLNPIDDSSSLNLDIMELVLDYQKLGNGYYSRKDLTLIK